MVSLEEIADHFRQMAWRQVKVEVGPASPAAVCGGFGGGGVAAGVSSVVGVDEWD